MRGGLQYLLLSVSVCVCHTTVFDDGKTPAADTVDASSMWHSLSVLNVSDFSLAASQLQIAS